MFPLSSGKTLERTSERRGYLTRYVMLLHEMMNDVMKSICAVGRTRQERPGLQPVCRQW